MLRRKRPRRVLIADDDPDILKVVAANLEAEGIDVEAVSNGFEAQAKGQFTAPDRFVVAPSHTHPLLVHAKDGHLKLVSYWCDVCTIRSYTPGPCVCCQKETTLDLIDPDGPEHK